MNFRVFKFNPQIQKALDHCGYKAPTPIQEQTIPQILAGRDLLGLAQTGTGKTAAFVLPILQHLHPGQRNKTRALIISPTRELAEQTHDYIAKMAEYTNLRSIAVYGGVSKQAQVKKIRQGVEIVIACPGRLLDLLNDRAINLAAVEMLVLDEADHMFDNGFLPDVRRILKKLPVQRQTLVFSATMPKEIRSLAEKILTHPATVQIDHKAPAKTISHAFYQVDQKNKTALLKKILNEKEIASAIIFTRTKHKARSLARQLQKTGCKATSLQGNLSQQKRQSALNGFKRGIYNILVATDIAARGIDVSGISHIINFDMPSTAETYTHRAGRTGRASCRGEAFTFATPEDYKMLKAIERSLGAPLVYKKNSDFTHASLIPDRKKEKQTATKKTRWKSQNGSMERKSRNHRAVACDFGVQVSV